MSDTYGTNWEFWLFLALTLLRQAPVLIQLYRTRRMEALRSTHVFSGMMIAFLYIVIWIISIIFLLLTRPSVVAVGFGTSLLTIGIGIRFVALVQLGLSYSVGIVIREGHTLKTSGIYALVRHPLHLALLVELLGMIVFTETWWSMPLWLVLIGMILIRNRQEDRILIENFGNEALKYQATTPSMNLMAHLARKFRSTRDSV